MKPLTDFSLLAYLHDAACRCIHWDCLDKDGRVLVLDLDVHPDTKFPDWDGRRMTLAFRNVALCRFNGWGHVAGGETIDRFDEKVSAEALSQCERLKASGLRVPRLNFSVSFISGSELELVCDRVEYQLT